MGTMEGLERAESLYERGLYVQALEALGGVGVPERGTDPAGMVFASRLLTNLGGERLGTALALRAWRRHGSGDDAGTVYPSVLFATLRVRGLLDALDLLEARPRARTPEARADGLIAEAQVLSSVRDFSGAHGRLDDAARTGAMTTWCEVTRAIVRAEEDQYGEARRILDGVLSRRPDYRPAIQHMAHLLILESQHQGAVELLEAASTRIESSAVLLQLGVIYGDAEDWEASLSALDRAEALMPYRDRSEGVRLAALRSDALYGLGRIEESLAQATKAGARGGFFKLIASSMESAPADAARVLLPVPFVRQHHKTCAPATMSAIGRFFDKPAPHLEVAEEICYDGTPNHSERAWAESEGWRSIEFTVTPAASRALLDVGLPFTLSTVFPTHAHLQAIVGYDDRRQTLIIRDPTYPRYGEMHFDSLELFASFGPRGHVFVPPELASRLDGIDLPDAALYDVHHRLSSALEENRREDAIACVADLRDLAPDHRLVHMGQLAIAAYDRDDRRALRALDGLGALFPEDPLVVTMRAARLRSLGRRAEAIALLERPAGDTRESDSLTLARPTLRRQLGNALLDDAREHDRAIRLLRRSARDGANLDRVMIDLARIASVREDTAEEIRLLRVALCLELMDEWVAGRFFWACRSAGRAEEGLAFLRDRFESLGDRSSHPGMSLHRALNTAGRVDEARAVLDEAVRRRPDDAELLLFCADSMVRRSEYDDAEALLDGVPEGRESVALPLRASIAQHRGDLTEARRCIGLAIQRTPLDGGLHQRYAELISDLEGPEAARRYMRRLFDQRPHSDEMAWLLVEQLSDHDHDGIIAIAQRVVEANPASAWGWRELALRHARLGRFEQADRFMREAEQLEPSDPGTLASRASIERDRGDLDAAEAAYRACFERDPSDPHALAGLVLLRSEMPWRNEQLEWAWGVLDRAPVIEETVMAWASLAVQSMERDRLLDRLERFVDARPLLRQGWFAWMSALTSTGELDRAKAVAIEACERFAWSAEPWYRRARVHYYRAEVDEERRAIERALEVDPTHVPSVRWLIDDAMERESMQEALAQIDAALARLPSDGDLLANKARVLTLTGDLDGALAIVSRLLEGEPDRADAWGALQIAAEQSPEAHDRVVTMLRGLCDRVPGSSVLRVRLAEMLPESDGPGRLRLIDEAIERNPRTIVAYELLAGVRMSDGDMAGAIDACVGAQTTRAFGGSVPFALRRLAVRIKAYSGHLTEACVELEAALEDDPQDVDGWTMLCDWLGALGRQGEADAAALRVSEIAPHEPKALVYAADAVRATDPDRAIDLFGRAVAIEPSYDYAHAAIAQLHLDAGRDREARAAIDGRVAVTQYPFVPLLSARLAMRAGDNEALVRAIRVLARLPDNESEFHELLGGIENKDARVVWSALQASIDAGEARGSAAYVSSWINCWASGFPKNQKLVHRRLKSDPDEVAIQMMNGHLDRLASGKHMELLAVTKKWREWIELDDDSWAQAAYRAAQRGEARWAWRWVQDWRSRSDLSVWALTNVMAVATEAKHPEEGIAAGEIALHRRHDSNSDRAAIWLALLQVQRGNLGPLHEAVTRLSNEPLGELERFLTESGALVLQMGGGDPAVRKQAVRALKRSLRKSPFRKWVGIRRLLRDAMRHVSR